MNVLVRNAEASEANAIADVVKAAFEEFAADYTAEAYRTTLVSAESIFDRIARGETLVACIDERVVGTVTLEPHEMHAHLRTMAVLPQARGKGVGRALLEEVERRARQAACSHLSLSTTPFLRAATRLYEHFGFAAVGDAVPSELYGTPLIRMVKGL